ncbi:MAG: thiamine pyrophosphate-dependent enzyme [Candidatus Bathyarchaeota archaeon]|nr:thiamine pyrophosphate-dependent enzyme [Candidatus Bathyarchaeota archaeon]
MDRRHLLMGNEAVARGVIEAGVKFAIGYPGTPSTEVIENLIQNSKEYGIRAEWAVNEKVAFDIATGISYGGARCLVTMKSAGLNVASDSILSVAYGDVNGGLVLYIADDSGAHAGMEEQDSRLFTGTCLLPMLDASDPQSLKDVMIAAFDLSERHMIPIMVRSTTRVAHGKASVMFGEIKEVQPKLPIKRDISRFTRASPVWVKSQHRLLIERVEKVREEIESSPLNSLDIKPGTKLGVIATGAPWKYLQDVLASGGPKVATLKIGTVHPLPTKMLMRFLESVDAVLVLEELEPFIEIQVKALIADLGNRVRVIGKFDGTLPRVGEYDYEIVEGAVARLAGRSPQQVDNSLEAARSEAKALAPVRSLPFCPGCPHRGTYTAMARALRELGFKKDDIIITGDIGCTILGMYPPWSSCWMEVSMGASIANAIGFKYAGVKTPVIATIGDSTFFHAGIPPTVNAGWNGTPIVIAVLDNQITGMTGHQASPASGRSSTGAPANLVKIEDMLKASGIGTVAVVDPYNLKRSTEAFKEAIARDGPSGIVFRRICSLVARRMDTISKPYRVETEICTGCLLCIRTLSCPAMLVESGKMVIDEVSCAGCGMCAQVCPVSAIEGGA